MPNGTNFLEKALLVQVETTKVRRILNFENSFEEFRDLVTQDEFYISMRKEWRDKENVRRV